MTRPGGPPSRGRHSSPDDGIAGVPTSHWMTDGAVPTADFPLPRPALGHPFAGSDGATGGIRRGSGLLDRFPDTGPVREPEWWSHGTGNDWNYPTARHAGDDRSAPRGWENGPGEHPSAPLPPRPPGVWDRLRPREDDHDDAETVAHPVVPGPPHASEQQGDGPDAHGQHDDERDTDAHPLDPPAWEDQTGGLDVIGAHVEEDTPRRRGLRRGRSRRAAAPEPHHDDRDLDDHDDLSHGDHDDLSHGDHDDLAHDDVVHVDGTAIPVAPYDHRRGRGRRRRRRPVAILLSLVVLAGIVAGIVLGGQRLLAMIGPGARDYSGQGSGTVQIRVHDGDTLSDIARTLVADGVIGSVRPFVNAAEAHPDATGIQPGVYSVHEHMSGQAALDMLLDPKARLLSRVTVPEGLTVTATLARIAKDTNTPIADLKAAAAAPAALGLPAYANGKLEGFLFPATYDFDPGTKPVDMLKQMVARTVQALDDLQIPTAQRMVVLTKASIVQAEAGSSADMGKVARVLDNRLAKGMPLQLDTTVNYANGKADLTTSAHDRSNPS
ncbi:MAG TPA: endolytic transglycosylase MltG, partial [Blastococcus sp.]|nr:endolytic transglycosylase MltG [Blastococcus sp.]